MRIALWELSNVILKLGFSRALDEAVNRDTENSLCTEYCRVLAFCFRGNKKKCVHQVQVVMPNSIFLTSVE